MRSPFTLWVAKPHTAKREESQHKRLTAWRQDEGVCGTSHLAGYLAPPDTWAPATPWARSGRSPPGSSQTHLHITLLHRSSMWAHTYVKPQETMEEMLEVQAFLSPAEHLRCPSTSQLCRRLVSRKTVFAFYSPRVSNSILWMVGK